MMVSYKEVATKSYRLCNSSQQKCMIRYMFTASHPLIDSY